MIRKKAYTINLLWQTHKTWKKNWKYRLTTALWIILLKSEKFQDDDALLFQKSYNLKCSILGSFSKSFYLTWRSLRNIQLISKKWIMFCVSFNNSSQYMYWKIFLSSYFVVDGYVNKLVDKTIFIRNRIVDEKLSEVIR